MSAHWRKSWRRSHAPPLRSQWWNWPATVNGLTGWFVGFVLMPLAIERIAGRPDEPKGSM